MHTCIFSLIQMIMQVSHSLRQSGRLSGCSCHSAPVMKKIIGGFGQKWQVASSGIIDCICDKHLNDLITSYGSLTIIRAESPQRKAVRFYPAEVLLRLVGGWKFAKLSWRSVCYKENMLVVWRSPPHANTDYFYSRIYRWRAVDFSKATCEWWEILESWIMREAGNYPHTKRSSVAFSPLQQYVEEHRWCKFYLTRLSLPPLISE